MKPSVHSSPLFATVQKALKEFKVLPESEIIAGVSGGMDSMVLLTILHQLGCKLTAAHVNFQLRGKDSDDDASLIRNWCTENDVDYLEHVVNTKQYAESHQLNTQSAAREIRYNWWKNLVETGPYSFVATAHHLDDSIETFFLNLLRGTGLKGLTGIPGQRDFFIRPMISIPKSGIEVFASTCQIPFRHDRSNATDDYQRNKIRHHLIPLVQELNKDFVSVMRHDMARINLEWRTWENNFQQWQLRNIIEKRDSYSIKVAKEDHAFLLKWLEEKGIPWSFAFDFISSTQTDSGKVLKYEDLELSRTSSGFYFEKIRTIVPVIIPGTGSFQLANGEFSIEQVSVQEFNVHVDPWIEYADLDHITWPLQLRHVLPGDLFQPIGMSGKHKKIQDYFVDLKLEHHEKNQVMILTSQEHILWVTGMRLDERVRVKPGSTKIYRLQFRQT